MLGPATRAASGSRDQGSGLLKRGSLAMASIGVVLLAAHPRAAEYAGVVVGAGVPIPGATVTATHEDKHVVTTTDVTGVFRFAELEDGQWIVRVEMVGFTDESRQIAVVSGAEPLTWNLALRPVEEIVRPDASSGSASPPSGSNVSNPPKAANVPSPASSPTPANASDPFGTADGYLLNGSVNNGAASPFAQMAAFGNNRRGQRSLYNGGVGIQLGNSALDARPFSFGGTQAPKPSYNDAQVLATFGGPIRIQRWFRNAPMVFLGYQRLVDHTATTQSAIVPTLLERAGDFSQSLDAFGRPIQIADPATGRPFANTAIPNARLSPQAQSLLQWYPLPNITGNSRFNYQTPLLTGTHQDAGQLRMTHASNGRNQLFGNASFQRTTLDSRTLFGFTDTTTTSTFDSAMNWMHRFSQFLSVRFQYQYNRLSSDTTPFFSGRRNVSGEAAITGNNQDPVNWGPPALAFSSGIAGLMSPQFGSTEASTHSVGVEVTRTIPRHTITFGGDVRPQLVDVFSQQDARGTFSFTGAVTGSDLADFLLGIPATSSIAFGNPDKHLRATSADMYVNDDYRVTPTLTVNAGVRWEYESPFAEAQNRLASLDVSNGFTAASTVTAANVTGATTGRQYPRSLIHDDRRGVQPRLGVAWRPIPGSSLVIRGGYGIYRNTKVYQPLALLLAQQPPYSKTLSTTNSAAIPLTLANGFPAASGNARNTFAIDPDFRVASVQSWQLSAQRDLPGSLTVIGTYSGTTGSHLMQEFLPNTYPAGAMNPCPACPIGFVYLTSDGTSLRNAAQVQVRRRLRNGLTATAQYTLAKATDNAAAFLRAGDGLQTTSAAGFVAQDWRNLDADHGPSSFDQRHQFMMQVQYTTGMGVTGGALLDGVRGALFKGWTLTGQLNTASGLPQTPVYLTTLAGTGVTGTVRASLSGASVSNIPKGYYANPSAYVAPAAGEWGTAGRNSIVGPRQFSLNAGVSRAFLLSNRITLDWRVDANNFLNTVTYTSINTIVGSPQFGLPTQANTMRKLQTSARLRF